MRREAATLLLVLGLLFVVGLRAGPATAEQLLPSPLKDSHCSTLARLHGVAHDKHLLWELCGYSRRGRVLHALMYWIIERESHWQPRAHNPSGAAGYAQFMPEWWAGRWRFDPYNGPLCIRVFYYCVTHPAATGGLRNWAY